MTYDKPGCVEDRVEDNCTFEQLVSIADGTTLMSFLDEETGVRMYLDWESGGWKALDDGWEEHYVLDDSLSPNSDPWDQNYASSAPTDGLQRFRNPFNGVEYEASVENGQRMLFNDNTGEWVPIPVSLEIYVPEVTQALYDIEQRIPAWTNVVEKVLALRQHGYDVARVVEWKLGEMAFEGETPGILQRSGDGDMVFNAKVALVSAVCQKLTVSHTHNNNEVPSQSPPPPPPTPPPPPPLCRRPSTRSRWPSMRPRWRRRWSRSGCSASCRQPRRTLR